jgi:ABC-type uncharacterized transport system substrate-binding protein
MQTLPLGRKEENVTRVRAGYYIDTILLNRPSGNVTGVCDFGNQLAGKRLRLLRDTVSKAAVFGLLVRQSHPNVESDTKEPMGSLME